MNRIECALCGNVDDLQVLNGGIVCPSCRECPHGEMIWVGTHCIECLCDLFTAQHLYGPTVVDFEGYVQMAWVFGLYEHELKIWNDEEFPQLDIAARKPLRVEAFKNYRFPFPLLHHMTLRHR